MMLHGWLGRSFVALTLSTLASSQVLLAQAGPTLHGNVVDPEGKVVVDAALVIRNETTGGVGTTVTDARGHFSVTGLALGPYKVEVAVPGFSIVRRNGVVSMERCPAHLPRGLTDEGTAVVN